MSGWRLVFVRDPERWGPEPERGVLGIQDLKAAVERVGLRPGDPVFVRPDFRVDPDLLDFVLSQSFRRLARSTRRNYATDIRLLLEWLWSRGLAWWQATEEDLDAYREFRCSSPLNPSRIGGDKWDREAAAFTLLYKWAKADPLPIDAGRREHRAANARQRNVQWLMPRTWRLWQDLGLRGLQVDGSRLHGWDGRTELRNTAFVQLQLSSGLRRQEGSGLLTFELPDQKLGRGCAWPMSAPRSAAARPPHTPARRTGTWPARNRRPPVAAAAAGAARSGRTPPRSGPPAPTETSASAPLQYYGYGRPVYGSAGREPPERRQASIGRSTA